MASNRAPVDLSATAALTPVADAQAKLRELIVAPAAAADEPLERALGRVLAKELTSSVHLPATDVSALDGYAVRHRDIAVGGRLPVAGRLNAGQAPGSVLPPASAVRVMTGAPLPTGTDTVVRWEDTDNGLDRVLINRSCPPGTGVRPRGEDVVPGQRLLARGRRLRPADLGVCAAIGLTRVSVSRQPRVGILSTGDEVVAVGRTPGPGQIVDCNAVTLAAAVTEAGGIPVHLELLGDDPGRIRESLRVAAASCDLIVSSAGVSVGDHDHIPNAVSDVGTVVVWRVAMRPGKPLLIGTVGSTPLIGLPGHPVSALVTFELFARPAILEFQGATDLYRTRSSAEALEPIPKVVGLQTYHRGVLERRVGALPGVRLTGSQSSGVLTSLVAADCLIVLEQERGPAASGEVLTIIELP